MPNNPIKEYGKLQWINGFIVGCIFGSIVPIYTYLLIKAIR